MNILDVAIRAVLVPFRSRSRCLAKNYEMYLLLNCFCRSFAIKVYLAKNCSKRPGPIIFKSFDLFLGGGGCFSIKMWRYQNMASGRGSNSAVEN